MTDPQPDVSNASPRLPDSFGPTQSQAGSGNPPGKGMRKAGKILTWIGIALTVVSIAGIVFGVCGITGAIPRADDVTEIDGTTTVTVPPDATYYLYAPAGSSGGCSIQDESGEEYLPPFFLTQTSSFTYNGQQYNSFEQINGQDSASFTITCESNDVIVAPPVGLVGMMSAIFGLVIGISVTIFAFILVAVGVGLWIAGARRLCKSQAQV